MREPTSLRLVKGGQGSQRFERVGTEGEVDAGSLEESELLLEKADALTPLLGERPVPRRGTAHRGGEVAVDEPQAVVARRRSRLVGETVSEEPRHEKVTGSVTGEHATGAVAPVGRRGEPDDDEPRRRIAPTRKRTAPVLLPGVRAWGILRDRMSPLDEPGAGRAAHDTLPQLLEAPLARVRPVHHDASHGTVSRMQRSRVRSRRPTVICLVRHGTTPTTGKVLPGRARGLHLAQAGKDEAEKVGEAFRDLDVAAVYASPLERARETAAPIAKVLGRRVVVEKGLVECDFGDWTGADLARLRKLPEWKGVQRTPSLFRFPKGESFAEMQARIQETLRSLCQRHEGETVVAVSHADCIKAALASALGVPLDLFQRIVIGPCSSSVVAYSVEGPMVLSMNSYGRPNGLAPSKEKGRR